jgi:hypothetical protein
MNGALHALVANHVVQGRVIFPGAGYLEMARATAATQAVLSRVFFLQPLAVEFPGLLIECAMADCRFDIRSLEGSVALTDTAVHCSGASITANDSWQRISHAPLRAFSCACASDTCALYDNFDAIGLQYGPGYRTLVQAWSGTSDAVAARLRVRLTHQGTQVQVQAHPADLDDAICAGLLLTTRSRGDGETRLPFAVDDAQLCGTPGDLWAVRTRRSVNPCNFSPICRLHAYAHRLWRGKLR